MIDSFRIQKISGVYFVRYVLDDRRYPEVFKIGCSKNIDNRMWSAVKEIYYSDHKNYSSVDLLGYVETKNPKEKEVEIHRFLSEHRIGLTEFFRPCNNIKRIIDSKFFVSDFWGLLENIEYGKLYSERIGAFSFYERLKSITKSCTKQQRDCVDYHINERKKHAQFMEKVKRLSVKRIVIKEQK